MQSFCILDLKLENKYAGFPGYVLWCSILEKHSTLV